MNREIIEAIKQIEREKGIDSETLLVALEDALSGCERILGDEFGDIPEHALYMIGAIDEAKLEAAAKKANAGKGTSAHDEA